MTDISAPIFFLGDSTRLPDIDAHLRPALCTGMLSLSGPSVTAEPGHLPVRGDLAHIKLAGRYFVPHYAVPMPHLVNAAGAILYKSNKTDADAVGDLAGGAQFDVLDIAGDWAWGQHGEDGPVGYVLLAALEAGQ